MYVCACGGIWLRVFSSEIEMTDGWAVRSLESESVLRALKESAQITTIYTITMPTGSTRQVCHYITGGAFHLEQDGGVATMSVFESFHVHREPRR